MPKSSAKLTRRRRRLRYAAKKALWAIVFAAGLVAADRLGAFGRAPVGDVPKYDGKTFRVARVVDGDTLDIEVPDGQHSRTRIRLWGVDTPETVKPETPPQHFGRQASEFVRRICLRQVVRLQLERLETRDRYGRLLAYIYLPDGRMLNGVLIEEGYGYADPRFGHTYMGKFRHLQRAAKDNRRGLWKDATNADLPYYYRDKLKLPAK